MKLYEVKFKGNAILRPAAGEEFRCMTGATIVGEVWLENASGVKVYRCQACAVREDAKTLGIQAANAGRTVHEIVGIQSEIDY